MAEYKLKTPLSNEDVSKLKSGDIVYLSGTMYTARDAAHKRLVDLILTPPKPGDPIGSAGPTTSYRMDPYAPILIEHGLKGMIGKGKRNEAVKEACKKYKAVYFGATGGAAALIAKAIKKAEVIAYPELGPEAVRRIEVEDFPVVVVNDTYGNDLYEEGRKLWEKK